MKGKNLILKSSTGVVLILVLIIFTVAIYSIPKSAESLRWQTADGYDCETTDNVGSYTCCKNITVVIGGVSLSANRCVNCGESMEGVITCGPAYFESIKSPDTGGVDPKVKNYALDLVGRGLAMGTQDGGQVDPKVKNSATALIGQGLTLLNKGGVKGGTVDPKVTKDANVLIDRLLSSDKGLIKGAQNINIPKTDQDNSTLLTEDGNGKTSNQTKVHKDLDGLKADKIIIKPD